MTDWNDNAKAAVREFANYIGQSDKCERYLVSVATKKTVADAVEWDSQIVYSEEQGPHFKATRKNLDKIAKDAQGDFVEVEQEGEKWTHTYNGEECYIATTYNDCAWVVRRITDDKIVPLEDLKPIKPAISEVEAWRYCVDKDVAPGYVMSLYDVVKD